MKYGETWVLQSFQSTQTSGDVNPNDGSRILREGLQIIQNLQPYFKNGEVAYCCALHGDAPGVELCIVYPIQSNLINVEFNGLPFDKHDAIPVLNDIATKNKHGYTGFSTNGKTLQIMLNSDIAARLSKLSLLAGSVDANYEHITKLIEKVKEAAKTHSATLEGAQPAFLLSRDHINALQNADDDALVQAMQSITTSFDVCKDKDVSASMKLVYMYATGIMYVHPVVAEDAEGLGQEDVLEVLHLVAEGVSSVLEGGIMATFGALMLFGAVLMLLSALRERAILLVVNDSKVNVKFETEYVGPPQIAFAKRVTVTDNMPAWTKDNDWAYTGLFVYDKNDGSTLRSVQGTTFVIMLDTGEKKFCIGMTAPTTQLNAVAVVDGDDAAHAFELLGIKSSIGADILIQPQPGNELKHSSIDGPPKVDVKIASLKGNTNHARAIITRS